jgi:hypothetical protein
MFACRVSYTPLPSLTLHTRSCRLLQESLAAIFLVLCWLSCSGQMAHISPILERQSCGLFICSLVMSPSIGAVNHQRISVNILHILRMYVIICFHLHLAHLKSNLSCLMTSRTSPASTMGQPLNKLQSSCNTVIVS